MDREAWCAAIHGVAKSWTRLSDWTELNWNRRGNGNVCWLMHFPGGTMIMNPPANAGDVRDLSWIHGLEDPLEQGMATHPRIRAWRIPWKGEPGGLQSIGWQGVGHDWHNLACTRALVLFVPAYTTDNWCSQKSNSGSLAPEPGPLTPLLPPLQCDLKRILASERNVPWVPPPSQPWPQPPTETRSKRRHRGPLHLKLTQHYVNYTTTKMKNYK